MPDTPATPAISMEWRGGAQRACPPQPFSHKNVPGDLEIGYTVSGYSGQTIMAPDDDDSQEDREQDRQTPDGDRRNSVQYLHEQLLVTLSIIVSERTAFVNSYRVNMHIL